MSDKQNIQSAGDAARFINIGYTIDKECEGCSDDDREQCGYITIKGLEKWIEARDAAIRADEAGKRTEADERYMRTLEKQAKIMVEALEYVVKFVSPIHYGNVVEEAQAALDAVKGE